MLVKQCNLCTVIETACSDEDTEYCYECATLINNMRIDAERKIRTILKDQYDTATTNSAAIMRLLEYLYNERSEEFTTQFGTQGQTLLKKALGIN